VKSTTPKQVRSSSQLDGEESIVSILRDLVMHGDLSPGQQLRQEELSEQLGVSRSPLREALRALETEGLVRHSRNQGYFVVKLNRSEFTQVYLMRRLLETELLSSVEMPTESELARLRALNKAVGDAAEDGSVGAMLAANRAFHFGIFKLSHQDQIVRQVQNLWHLSEAYRATYLWLPDTRERVLHEHEQMLDALTTGDVPRLIEICDKHRSTCEDTVVRLISR
jgi:DNA-binding GntR family transcriptional regulator